MVDLSELDRDALQAHLSLHSWIPAYGLVSRKLQSDAVQMNAKMVIGEDRWFAVTGERGSFAIQTGTRNLLRKYREVDWSAFSDGELRELGEAMVSYGELHERD